MQAAIPEDEAQRLRALYGYGILDTDSERTYDDLTLLASAICRTPIAAISLIDEHRQWFKSAVGLDVPETHRDIAFCAHAIINRGATLIVEDATLDDRFVANPLVTGMPGIRFYAGTPLLSPAGHAVGTLCVIDTEPRKFLNHERAALEALGRQAMALLELRRHNSQLKTAAQTSVSTLRRARSLHRVTTALIEQHDLEELLQIVVDLIATSLPADRVTIFTVDIDTQNITHFKKGGKGVDSVVPVAFDELWHGLSGWVLRNRVPALSPKSEPDLREQPAVQERRRQTNCGDIIVVPILYKEQILGTITAINSPESEEFGSDQVDLMVAMAAQVAVAIRTTRLFSDLTTSSVALKAATERMTLATDAAGMGIWEWDVVRNEVRWDDQMYRIFGCTRSSEIETYSLWANTLHRDDRDRAEREIHEALNDRGDFDTDFRIVWPDGSIHHLKATAQVQRDSAGLPLRMVGINFDITQRKAAEQQLAQDARHDKLTGLTNRALFMERLTKAIARINSGQQAVYGVLFLDFDRFKHINDTLGHDAGDELLRKIAARLRGALRASDSLSSDDTGNVISRFGGDEFLILLNDIKSSVDTLRVSERLLNTLAPSYTIQGTEVHSTASIGIVTSDMCSGGAEEIVRNADLAMYEAKRAGRACSVVFNETMHARLTRHVMIETSLRKAIGTAALYVVYQPIVELDSGHMVSAEALVRWDHPVLGSLAPSEFIPIAEESGLIIALDRWVRLEACRTLTEWRRDDPRRAPKSVSVNVSRAELALGDEFLEQVRDTLEASGLPPECLQLEVTEREITRHPEVARALLQRLKELGVRIAMDDFGTGTSSLGFLRNYPFDCIKIDQSFVKDLTVDQDALAVIHATVNLIENLNMTSLAEGVEEPGQVGILQAMGCRHAQGCFFSHPLRKNLLLDYAVQQPVLLQESKAIA